MTTFTAKNIVQEQRRMLQQLGFGPDFFSADVDEAQLIEFVNLKLHARGLPIYGERSDYPYFEIAESLLTSIREKNRLLADHLCPADRSIQDYLTRLLDGVVDDPESIRIPTNTLILERHGLSKLLSIPPDQDSFESDIVKSYRVKQGVCHNPKRDRRTTKGVFHITADGLPIPGDKKEVPRIAFARLLESAINPPDEMLRLPFTSTQEKQAEVFCSLLLRPLVSPEVPGVSREKRLEVRFFAPGNLVCNLDFVESIFGNAGDPYLPMNDARLDVDHWTGHTGCVILAPHLVGLTKKELGLPHVDDATERQIKDGMCWSSPDEKYNDGSPFKLCSRDAGGVMVTLIADNYFGYCKKEVKTLISFAANLYGLCEEEHAGGALVFPRRDHGEEFHLSLFRNELNHTFAEVCAQLGDQVTLQPEGYAIDATWDDIYYVPEDSRFDLRKRSVTWLKDGTEHSIALLPKLTYILPSGYKISMEKPAESLRWRIVGTNAQGTSCHKPCTVSGGGKSEISKPITDAMVGGFVHVQNFKEDFDEVERLLHRDYGERYANPNVPGKTSRPLLSMERSLGSVIKMLNPNPQFTPEYNEWVKSIPSHIRDLVLLVKRFYKEHWGKDWRERFSVDRLNGQPGNTLKYFNEKIANNHLRVGFDPDGSWRTFTMRKDFMAADKIQTQDDISASITVPAHHVKYLSEQQSHKSVKFIENCEFRLFQRPDDAIYRGYDKTAEADFITRGNFFSNYEPLPREDAEERVRDAVHFDLYTEGIRDLIQDVADGDSPDYYILTSDPRILEDGSRTKNPRYLQIRTDLQDPRKKYLANLGLRLYRRIPAEDPVPFPVDVVLPGRRHNPPDVANNIRALAVFNPIHYQELPELFIDFIASLTGKSPSTTGAGSEGALTKAPFNALPPIVDLNNALTSYLVSGYKAFVTAAGYVGPKMRVDHDISLLMPELWSRMRVEERNPVWLHENGYLEKMEDFEHEGETVLASRLGYRITDRFADDFFGRMFSYPGSVFTEDMLKPELQDLDTFVDGMRNIVQTSENVAKLYFEDGSIENACPPLKALIHIMAHGEFEGKGLNDPAIRELFNPDTILEQDWYKERIETRKRINKALHERNIAYLEAFLSEDDEHEVDTLSLARERLDLARERLAEIQKPEYLESLVGTIGADPMLWS